MGNMIDMAIVRDCSKATVKRYLNEWISGRDSYIDPGDCVMNQQKDGVVILLNHGSCLEGHDGFFDDISAKNCGTVLAVFVYDSDYWGYTLYDSGKEIDAFCTRPDWLIYGEVTEEKLRRYKGNSRVLARYFNVSEASIKNYLIPWEDDSYDKKAYPDDKHGQEDWQILDFMAKLGYEYPEDDGQDENTDDGVPEYEVKTVHAVSSQNPEKYAGSAVPETVRTSAGILSSLKKLFGRKTPEQSETIAGVCYSLRTNFDEYQHDQVNISLFKKILNGFSPDVWDFMVLSPAEPIQECTFVQVGAPQANTQFQYTLETGFYNSERGLLLYRLYTKDQVVVLHHLAQFWQEQIAPDISSWEDVTSEM